MYLFHMKKCFKSSDFHVEDRHNVGRAKVFEDEELEAWLMKRRVKVKLMRL